LPKSFVELLAERGDPMAGAKSAWASHLLDIPDDSRAPLAMTGPHPLAVGSYGLEMLEWAKKEIGFKPRWWQELAIVRQLEHDDAGRLVWREVVESGPRRIGKSVRLRAVALWRTDSEKLFGGPQHTIFVSKDLAIAKAIHSVSWQWADRRGWKVDQTGGSQSITKPLTTRGASLEESTPSSWMVRSVNSSYGYAGNYAQVDEAWDIDPAAVADGLEPTMMDQISPQIHLTSTAHVKASSLLRRRLSNGLAGVSEDSLLLMWGARPDADNDDPDTWRSASPHWSDDRATLMRQSWTAAREGVPEADDPDPLRGWAAQYLNVWPFLLNAGGSKVLPKWGDLSVPVRVGVPNGLGVATDPQGTWLSFGGVVAGEPPFLGLLARLPVSQRRVFVEEVARVSQKYDCPVVVDKGGPASFLISDFENAHVRLEPIGTDRYVQAVADLVQAVDAGEVEHGGYPDLDAATVAADWRMIGDRRVFARRSGDISALEAVTLAHHGSIGSDSWSGIL
jgi:hypothetical protein